MSMNKNITFKPLNSQKNSTYYLKIKIEEK